ncbi:MAG: FAD-dependent oxidoreductase, partial [Gammaproteobacteria bacterium]|nr:FAD-dependent oxidoreductase [Gammaproteobacteria bacterium]
MANPQYDIAIIGGGMVGATMAIALAQLPLRIAIIEAFPFRSDQQPSYDARSIALAYGSKRIFETLGVWNGMEQDACPIKKIHVSSQGQAGATHLNAMDEGLDALGYVIENRIIGNALLAQIENYSNIELICPASLDNLNINADWAEVSITQNGEAKTINTKLVIAADGANSKVRELLGIQSTSKDYQQTAIISNVTPGKPHKNIAYERFTKDGPIAVLPMTDNRCSLVYTVSSDKVEETLA